MPRAARASTYRHNQPGGRTIGRVLRYRLGRRPPRHRPGRPRRAAAGPPPHQRRRGRAGHAAGPARRARRHRRRPRPGGDRDPARAADGLPARHRPPGLPDQPDGGGPLPGPALVAGRRSDHGDSVVLANVLRTDMHAHRPLPADTELAQAIAVLARAQQDAVWDRTSAHNKLRSHLREYYPGFLAAFADARDGIMRPEARAILAAAPAPAAAAKLTLDPARALLREAGRRRGIDAEAARLREAFRARADAPAPPRRAGDGPPGPGPAPASWTPPAPTPATSSRPPPSLLTSTRTPGSSPASQGSARSPAPGCSPRSATTGPASPMPKDSRPTPGPRPSPAPAAKPTPSCTAGSRTSASPPPATPGRSPP